jgi:hypothetical protein
VIHDDPPVEVSAVGFTGCLGRSVANGGARKARIIYRRLAECQ